jgi:hypothetical protein
VILLQLLERAERPVIRHLFLELFEGGVDGIGILYYFLEGPNPVNKLPWSASVVLEKFGQDLEEIGLVIPDPGMWRIGYVAKSGSLNICSKCSLFEFGDGLPLNLERLLDYQLRVP